MIWMFFNGNHSAKTSLLQLNWDFCVSIVACFIILYFEAVQNPTARPWAFTPIFFPPHTSLALSAIEVTICHSHLSWNTTMQSMTHFISVSRKGGKKKKETKQPFPSALNTLVIFQPRIEWGCVDMTLFFFTLSHLLPDISRGRID